MVYQFLKSFWGYILQFWWYLDAKICPNACYRFLCTCQFVIHHPSIISSLLSFLSLIFLFYWFYTISLFSPLLFPNFPWSSSCIPYTADMYILVMLVAPLWFLSFYLWLAAVYMLHYFVLCLSLSYPVFFLRISS